MTATGWIESLSPWPAEFGLGRMRALLRDVGNPQRHYPTIHVVGTNGKSTATRTVETLLEREGLAVGAYVSPHVRGWSERIRVRGAEADFDEAVEAIRGPAQGLGATQFEALTAAALVAFAAGRVDVAVVEAGLGGRLDATNVVDAPVVLLTNVAREHAEVLGDTLAEIAQEKLAVTHAARVVVLPDNTYAQFVRAGARIAFGGPREAAEAFLERPVESSEVDVSLPGRVERVGAEIWDGAHNPAGVAWLVGHLHDDDERTVVASILADKDATSMLALLARVGSTLVATRSSSGRARPAEDLASLAQPYFRRVEAVADPHAALARARSLGGPLLVTGSLYLLADLYGVRAHAVR